MFDDSLGNRDLPIIVHYYMPAVPNTDTPIVIVMPGASRDGPRYHSDWVPEAERYGFLLLVPEFGIDHYPGSAMYNLGNMFTEEHGGDPVDESKWTFTAIEHLFEYVKTATGITRERFLLYGHSAGSQFVHRFLFFRPNAPVERAVAANAGWYTLPVETLAWPYGLDGSEAERHGLVVRICRPDHGAIGRSRHRREPAEPPPDSRGDGPRSSSLRARPYVLRGGERFGRGEGVAVRLDDRHGAGGYPLGCVNGAGCSADSGRWIGPARQQNRRQTQRRGDSTLIRNRAHWPTARIDRILSGYS